VSDDTDPRRTGLVRNERLKLAATYLNGLAIALFAVGSVGPVISIATSAGTNSSRAAGLIAFICAFVSAALHYAASRVLGGLRP